MQRGPSSHAFTVLEVMISVSLLAALAVLGGFTWRAVQDAEVKSQAEELVRLFTEARETAMRRGAPVRVAFSLPVDHASKDVEAEGNERHPPRPAVAAYIFMVPEDMAQVTCLATPTARTEGEVENSRLTEWIPVAGGPLPEALLGQWTVMPGRPQWEKFTGRVRLEGELLSRARGQSSEEFAAENFSKPMQVWGRPGTDHEGIPCSWASPVPPYFAKLPWPARPYPKAAPLADDEKWPVATKPAIGRRALRHFPKAVREKGVLLDLPALEFQPDGSLACKWTHEIRLRVQPQQRETPVYEIIIPVRDARARIAGDGDHKS